MATVKCKTIGLTSGKFTSSWRVSRPKEHDVVSIDSNELEYSDPTSTTLQFYFNVGAIPSNAKGIKAVILYKGSNKTWKVTTSAPTITTKSGGKNVQGKITAVKSSLGTTIGSHKETLTLTDISLGVSYTVASPANPPSATNNNQQTNNNDGNGSRAPAIINYATGFLNCDSMLSLYDKEGKKLYMFDGVVKLGYNFNLSIEDESVKGDDYQYTNNAKLQPAEISAEIVMSDTSHGASDLTGETEYRAKEALNNLYNLQKSRKILEVITPEMTWPEMLIKSVAVTVDDKNMVGWSASIVLHQRLLISKPTNGSTGNTAIDPTRTNSNIANLRYGVS